MLRQKSFRTLSSAVARSFPVQLNDILLQERSCFTGRRIGVLLESLRRRASPEDWPTDTKSTRIYYIRDICSWAYPGEDVLEICSSPSCTGDQSKHYVFSSSN